MTRITMYTDGAARGNPDLTGRLRHNTVFCGFQGAGTYQRAVSGLSEDNKQPHGNDGGDRRA